MTQEIQWGPAIAVDGKRPQGLTQADTKRMLIIFSGGYERMPMVGCDPLDQWGWEVIDAIKLPADHPHYRQPEKVGDAHLNAAPIDWSGELEAVHEDGRVVAVRLSGFDQPDHDGDYSLSEFLDTRRSAGKYFKADGSQSYGYADGGRPWRIRNVPQPTPQADTKPDLKARMEALVRYMKDGAREILKQYPAETTGLGHAYSEAAAIYELMNPAVDPDEQYARDLIREQGWSGEREIGSEAVVAMIVKTRRALALAGEKEA